MCPIFSSAETPPINFVWVGPPRFNRGGQDVLGPETIDANFKRFPTESSQNPMIFWCQKKYKDQYKEYFAERGISITVKTIEEGLEASSHSHAAVVLGHYRELTKEREPTKEVSRTLNYVFFKDMFFNFLLATQGGYVMDTGIYADSSKPVTCRAYDTIKFPVLRVNDSESAIEVWMQYAPRESVHASKFLDDYLTFYSETMSDVKDIPSEKIREGTLHRAIGEVATQHLDDLLSRESTGGETYTWRCPSLISSHMPVPECGISKLYFNSHRTKSMPPIIAALTAENMELLALLFAHGIIDDINRTYDREGCRGETILTRTTISIVNYKPVPPKKIALIAFILEHGANPNVVYHIGEEVRTPLMDAVETLSPEVINLLLSKGARPQDVDREAILAICNQSGTPPEIKELLSPHLGVVAGAGAPATPPTTEARTTQSQIKSELSSMRLEEGEATAQVGLTKTSH